MNALRNLQIFRNGEPIVGTMAVAKATVEAAFSSGTLVLNDGEPISIRYQVDDVVKGLYGVAYINGNERHILWASSDISVLPPQGVNDYIHVTEGDDGSFTVGVNIVPISSATTEADGLASAADVRQYILNTFKDKFVKDGSVMYLGDDASQRSPGDEGYVETDGDEAYLVLLLEGGSDGTSDDFKIYIPVSDMVPDESQIRTWAEEEAKQEIQGLGSVTADTGKYFTGISVDSNGQLQATQADLPTSENYDEGHDIDFRTTGDTTYVDTALDADIQVAGLTNAIGGVGTNDKFTAGMTLSDILKKIFVKDVDVKTTNPAITFNISDSTLVYEYGSSVTKTLSVSNYIDGYFSPENTAYTAATFNTNNNTTGGKLNAGCTKGNETYSANTGTVSVSTWTNTNLTSVTTLTANVPYGNSTVTAKTMANQNSSKSIAAGTLTRTKTVTPYYRFYAGVIDGTDFGSSDFATVSGAINSLEDNKYKGEWLSSNGYYMEGSSSPVETPSTSVGAYIVDRGKSLVVLTQAGKTVTATYDDNSSSGTFETRQITRVIDGNIVNYQINWLSNLSSNAAMTLYNLKVQ